jgi:hypothetical protein
MFKRMTTFIAAGILGLVLVASGCAAHAGADVGYPSTTYVVGD